MISGLRQWRHERRKRHEAQLYRDGFEWAAGERYVEGTSWAVIALYVMGARANKDYTAFDKGVEAAIKKFRELETHHDTLQRQG